MNSVARNLLLLLLIVVLPVVNSLMMYYCMKLIISGLKLFINGNFLQEIKDFPLIMAGSYLAVTGFHGLFLYILNYSQIVREGDGYLVIIIMSLLLVEAVVGGTIAQNLLFPPEKNIA